MVGKENKEVKSEENKRAELIKKEGGAGIVDEEVRKEDEIIHKGRPGEIDDEEGNTDQKGFDRSVD
jgi:hypothetical protein